MLFRFAFPAARPRALPALAVLALLAACADRDPVAPALAGPALDAGAPAPSVTPASSPWHVELGMMGGTESRAAGLNEAGQVVGTVTLANGSRRGFVWTPSSPGAATGTMVALQPPAGSGAAEALAINESGTVVGFYSYPNRAALWMPADSGYTAVHLGGLSARWPRSVASAINDAGQVAGMSHQELDYRRAVLWTPASPGSTTFTLGILGDLGGNDGVANGINNAGYVVGAARLGGYGRAFLWKPGAVRVIAISSIKTRDSHGAWGINDAGEVVGGGADLNAGGIFDHSYAWVWTPSAPGATTGTRRRLAPEASSAHHSEGLAINAHGQVAGVQRYFVYPAFVEEPVVWMGGVRRVLHLPPGHQGVATAIADDGRVAGRMKGPDGKWRAVLWHALAPAPAVTAALAAPASPVSARTYTYDASASVHSDGRPLTFHWDLDGDGTTDSTTGTTPSTTLALRAGTHTVRVIATADGLADTASVTVTVVRNLAPIITLGPAPGQVPEGSAVSYTFTVADADHARFTYDW
ncbi:MAG TPA: PKD domain-containing protein, partial [Longimicrobium sp.]|nr:PKD domain-containing protein [Longimicrobium sp.]